MADLTLSEVFDLITESDDVSGLDCLEIFRSLLQSAEWEKTFGAAFGGMDLGSLSSSSPQKAKTEPVRVIRFKLNEGR